MFFNNCQTPAEVKNRYRSLALQNHPDRGGTNEVMKQINAAYHQMLKMLDGYVNQDVNGKEYTYRYNKTAEQSVMDKVQELLGLDLNGCTVEIVGTWIWIGGNTKPHRHILSNAKCVWHRNRKLWYWHPPKPWRTRYNKKMSYTDLRRSYGVSGRWDIEKEPVTLLQKS